MITAILDNITELILLVFIAITFGFSALENSLNWTENIATLKAHFDKTFMAKMVPLSLFIIAILEVFASVLALAGIVSIIIFSNKTIGLYSAILSAITLLLLLFGQRVAKDYEGAKTIVIYLIPTVISLYLLK